MALCKMSLVSLYPLLRGPVHASQNNSTGVPLVAAWAQRPGPGRPAEKNLPTGGTPAAGRGGGAQPYPLKLERKGDVIAKALAGISVPFLAVLLLTVCPWACHLISLGLSSPCVAWGG